MKTFSLTDIGRDRESNQDYVYTSESPVGNLPNLFIVADGMGGRNSGDFASKYTVEQITKDHSLVQKMVRMGEIVAVGSEIHSGVSQAKATIVGLLGAGKLSLINRLQPLSCMADFRGAAISVNRTVGSSRNSRRGRSQSCTMIIMCSCMRN